MGCYRVPSPTPSVESEAPTEAPTVRDDPESRRPTWVVYVGNLHPDVKRSHLHDLFKGCDSVGSITIRTSRGGPRDRCYASVVVRGAVRLKEVLSKYNKNPPKILGLPVILSLGAVDMPDFKDLLERTLGYAQEKTGNKSPKSAGKPTPSKKIAREETEPDI